MSHDERKLQEIEIKRKDIINAAERVFFSKGYENASMDEVAAEAEYSKRTVYTYFKSKEQIYFEIMIRGYRLFIRMIEDSLNETSPHNALDELRCIFFAFFNFSEVHREYFKAIMEYETKDPLESGVEYGLKQECYKLGEQAFGYLARALQKGLDEKSLVLPGNDSGKAALTLWACAIGIFITGEIKGDYLKSYHHTDPKEFVTASFYFVMRLVSGKGMDL